MTHPIYTQLPSSNWVWPNILFSRLTERHVTSNMAGLAMRLLIIVAGFTVAQALRRKCIPTLPGCKCSTGFHIIRCTGMTAMPQLPLPISREVRLLNLYGNAIPSIPTGYMYIEDKSNLQLLDLRSQIVTFNCTTIPRANFTILTDCHQDTTSTSESSTQDASTPTIETRLPPSVATHSASTTAPSTQGSMTTTDGSPVPPLPPFWPRNDSASTIRYICTNIYWYNQKSKKTYRLVETQRRVELNHA